MASGPAVQGLPVGAGLAAAAVAPPTGSPVSGKTAGLGGMVLVALVELGAAVAGALPP
ncbi:MAG TPA: hypothetical protein VG276_05435 [Actinomycetes bacterium]|nr:hypothetical protein [Actinomycetes bacterium]